MKHPIKHMWGGLGFIAAVGLLVILFEKFADAKWDEVNAAWVQAIGSLLAIGAAVYIMQAQRQYSRTTQDEIYRAARRSALAGAQRAAGVIAAARTKLRTAAGWRILRARGPDLEDFATSRMILVNLMAKDWHDEQVAVKLSLLLTYLQVVQNASTVAAEELIENDALRLSVYYLVDTHAANSAAIAAALFDGRPFVPAQPPLSNAHVSAPPDG